MALQHSPFALLATLLAGVAGVALQLQQEQLWEVSNYALFLALTLVLIGFVATKKVAKQFLVIRSMGLFLAMVLLGFSTTGLRSHLFLAQALPAMLEGRDVDVQGVVQGLPQSHPSGVRFRLEVEQAWLNGQSVDLPALVDVGWYSGWGSTVDGALELQRQPIAVQPGERWRMRLRLKAPHGNMNPHGFDYELSLWEQGVQASAYVRAGKNDPAPQRLATTWQHLIEAARYAVRDRIAQQVQSRQAASLVSALVVGDQAAIDRVDWDVYRATGVAHLVSISGLHITGFAWLASVVVGWLWRRSVRACLWRPAPVVALWSGVLLATLYALFAGWGIPAQRTVLMLFTVATLRSSGVRWPWPVVWMLACAVVVAWDPWALLQAGFWLSFVAVGVLFATDLRAKNVDAESVRGKFVAIFREQGIISLALAPLGIVLFGQVSLVGMVANLWAVPWVTLVLTPLSMLGVFVPAIWTLAEWAALGFQTVLTSMAQWPGAVWWWPRPPLLVGLAACLGGVFLVLPWSWRMRTLAMPFFLPLFFWRPALPAPNEFMLLAADVGQGNAVLVRTATHTLLLDAGPRYGLETDAGHRVMVPLLQALQWPLDMLVLTHRDTDHVGGAQSILRMHPQAQLLSSLEPEHPLLEQRKNSRCEAGQRWVWDGVEFSVLHPTAQDYERQASLPSNAMSCVLRISNGAHSALLVGDIEKKQEIRLTETEERGTTRRCALGTAPR